MFTGEYSVNLGEKNRLAIPKIFRDDFNGNIFITRGFEKSLILVDESRWNKLVKEIKGRNAFDKHALDTMRFIVGGAYSIEPDKQGRFVISEPLREFAEIETEATFLGVQNWVEIWSKPRWETHLNSIKGNMNTITKHLQTNEY